MATRPVSPLPTLQHLPTSLPLDGALRLELQEGVPILRASATVRQRIATLVKKAHEGTLVPEDTAELDRYEELDDYLSFLNRVVRNLLQPPQS